MEISKNKVVTLSFELRVDGSEGEVIEQVTKERPLSFLYGAGNMLEKFESNLTGLNVGQKFDFMVEYADAYGDVSDEAIVDLPLNLFEVDGKLEEGLLEVGNTVPMQDNQGNRFNGTVVEVGEEVVSMDFNHPLAGEDLFFSGEILDIREATEEEISHGHIHGANSCDSDCDSDCEEGDEEHGCGCCGHN